MNAPRSRNTVPLSAPLFLLLAVGVLMIYFKYLKNTRFLTKFDHLFIPILAASLASAGIWQFMDSRRGSRGERERVSQKTLADKLPLRIAWWAVLLVLLGVRILLEIRNFPEPVFRGSLIVAGAACIFWGLQGISSRGKPTRRKVGRVRHSIEIPIQGAIYLVIMIVLGVGSMLSRSNMLLLVFAMMAAPFVLNGWIIFSMLRRLAVQRRIPETVMAGEAFTVEVVVTNEKRVFASSLLTLTDQVRNGIDAIEPSALVARVPPKESRIARYQLRLMHRGRCEFLSLKASTQFPLGIVERGVTVELPDELLVLPRIGRLTPAWKREHGIADEMVSRSDTRKGVFDDEFHRLREYRIGDNPRSIHWRTSARQNELMLREYHQSRNFELTILIDLWHPQKLKDADQDRIELAISFAATLAREQLVQSRDSGLNVAVAGQTFDEWNGPGGPSGLQSLLELLAAVRAGSAPATDELTRFGRGHRGPATRAIWVTSRPPHGAPWSVLDDVTGGSDFGRELRVFSSEPRDLQRWFALDD